MREISVVRQEERAGRVDVEPPDGDDARFERHEIDDGPPPLRIARGRHDARRLVQEHVREPLPLDARTVDLDDVVPPDDGVQLPLLAVHAHTSVADELVGATARRDPRPGEVGVEAHRCILASGRG